MRKVAVSLADSIDLRIILSVLYIITEVMRAEKESGSKDYEDLVENFEQEISKTKLMIICKVFLIFLFNFF